MQNGTGYNRLGDGTNQAAHPIRVEQPNNFSLFPFQDVIQKLRDSFPSLAVSTEYFILIVTLFGAGLPLVIKSFDFFDINPCCDGLPKDPTIDCSSLPLLKIPAIYGPVCWVYANIISYLLLSPFWLPQCCTREPVEATASAPNTPIVHPLFNTEELRRSLQEEEDGLPTSYLVQNN